MLLNHLLANFNRLNLLYMLKHIRVTAAALTLACKVISSLACLSIHVLVTNVSNYLCKWKTSCQELIIMEFQYGSHGNETKQQSEIISLRQPATFHFSNSPLRCPICFQPCTPRYPCCVENTHSR